MSNNAEAVDLTAIAEMLNNLFVKETSEICGILNFAVVTLVAVSLVVFTWKCPANSLMYLVVILSILFVAFIIFVLCATLLFSDVIKI